MKKKSALATLFEGFGPTMKVWLATSVCLMCLQWWFVERGGAGFAYNTFFPPLFAVFGLPLLVLIEAANPCGDDPHMRHAWLFPFGLLASLLSYAAAIGLMVLLGPGWLQHPALLRLQMLLLLPAQAALLVLVYGLVLAVPLLRAGRRWEDIWRLAWRVKLTTYTLVALVFIVLGSYNLLKVPHVRPRGFGLPQDLVLYYRAADGGAMQRLRFAEPLSPTSVSSAPDPDASPPNDACTPLLLHHGGPNCRSPFKLAYFSDGLHVPEGGMLKLMTLGTRMSVHTLYVLNDHMVLFALGDREIVVYDARLRHLTVLASGSHPLVVREKAPAN